jgi:hypothetical protein
MDELSTLSRGDTDYKYYPSSSALSDCTDQVDLSALLPGSQRGRAQRQLELQPVIEFYSHL